MTNRIFINRRSGGERRGGGEQRVNPRLDLSYRRRRKTENRRNRRNITDDFYASQAVTQKTNPVKQPTGTKPTSPH